MRPDLDEEGAAAPPRANGELAFGAPWQSRLFATTMATCDAGLIEYEAFRQHLIDRVAEHDEHGPDDYWAAWQDAFEAITVDAGLVGETELADRASAFDRHP